MATMQLSKIRQASQKNRKKACATKLTASSTAKRAVKTTSRISKMSGMQRLRP